MGTGIFASTAGFYIHNHLYSPVALIDYSGSVLERYEYDAYGSPTIWNGDFTVERSSPSYSPFLFTGREVDYLDSGSLKIQYNRNRYYDYYTGRWLTHDPHNYVDSMNLYEYVRNNPMILTDPIGGCAGSGLTKLERSDLSGYGCKPEGHNFFFIYAWSSLAHGITPEEAETRAEMCAGAMTASLTPIGAGGLESLGSACCMITESMVQDKLVEGHHINLRDIVVTGSIISETVDWYAYYDEYTCVKNTECVNLCGFAEIPKYILKKTNSTGNEWQCMEYDIPLVGERRLGNGDSIFPPPISEEFPIGSLPGDPDPGEFKKRCPAGTRCTPPGVCIDALRETMGDTTELFPSVWDYYDWR